MATITPLSNTETAAFCSQMAMILKSGISPSEGISIMTEDSRSEDEKQLLNAIYGTLIDTGSLYMALSDTHAFPDYMIAMVQIGEQTGRMDDVMNSLGDYYEKEAGLVQTIKNAITYPCIMIFMMIAVILLLITQVMPIFNQVFNQLGTEMNGISKAILMVGLFLSEHSIVLIALLVLLIAAVVFLVKTQKGQHILTGISSRFSGTKALSEQIASYRFANGMSLTLSSGLPPEECLNLTSGLISGGSFHHKVETCQSMVSQGDDLYDSLLSCGIFSGVYTRMASIAARTGMMDEMMKKIADHYEEEIDSRIARILSTVEPTLVIILSVIVGIILLSVMIPLIHIMSAL